jgi:hypothetical protein
MAPRSPVTAPPAQPPRYGLLVALGSSTGAMRWEGGVDWKPEQCGASGIVDLSCEGNPSPDSVLVNQDNAAADPWVVFAEAGCSTFGFMARDFGAEARRQLEATRSYQVAHELWRGDLGTVTTKLSDGNQVTDEPSSIKNALGYLEAAIADCSQGRRGAIHMSPQALIHAVGQYLLERDSSGQWITPLGTLVIADAGYDGSDADGQLPGDSQWMWGSTMPQVLLSPVDVNPPDIDSARLIQAAAVDRSINLVHVTAQQLALVQLDPCCLFGAELDIATDPTSVS